MSVELLTTFLLHRHVTASVHPSWFLPRRFRYCEVDGRAGATLGTTSKVFRVITIASGFIRTFDQLWRPQFTPHSPCSAKQPKSITFTNTRRSTMTTTSHVSVEAVKTQHEFHSLDEKQYERQTPNQRRTLQRSPNVPDHVEIRVRVLDSPVKSATKS